MNNHIFILKIKYVVKTLLTRESSGLYVFTGEVYQICKEEIILILHKFFLKMSDYNQAHEKMLK